VPALIVPLAAEFMAVVIQHGDMPVVGDQHP